MMEHGPILCLVGWWPEPGSVAGIFILEHLQAIARHRAVEVVYTTVEKSHRPVPTITIRTGIEAGLTVHRIQIRTPIRRYGVPTILVRMAYKRLLRRVPKPALVHIHVRTDETACGTGIARALGVPVVVTEHNSFYHLGIRALPPKAQATERARIAQWFADPTIARVMPVSNDLARVLVYDHGVREDLVTVIPNVAADVFHAGPPPPPGSFRMLLAAVWRPPKDHDVFIRAMRELPDTVRRSCIVEWAGYGPDMATIVQRCAAELPDVDIRFPGLLSKSEMADAMRQAHLFILPTKADNLPCVVLESHCCGTPVLSMRVNGLPELIDDTNGVLVPPSSPQALAKALEELMTSKHRFDRQTIANTARQRYAASAVGARIDQVYREVLGVKADELG